MKLNTTTATKIVATYSDKSVDAALAEIIRRHGGLYAALNDDARRDLILTLGDNRRSRNAFDASQREKRAAFQLAAE